MSKSNVVEFSGREEIADPLTELLRCADTWRSLRRGWVRSRSGGTWNHRWSRSLSWSVIICAICGKISGPRFALCPP